MSNRIDYTTIEVPVVLRDRIAEFRTHPRQPYHEVIEEMLGWWAESVPPAPRCVEMSLPPRRRRL